MDQTPMLEITEIGSQRPHDSKLELQPLIVWSLPHPFHPSNLLHLLITSALSPRSPLDLEISKIKH